MAQFRVRITERTENGPYTVEHTEYDMNALVYNWGQLVRAALPSTIITVYNGVKLIACRTNTVCWNKFKGNEK